MMEIENPNQRSYRDHLGFACETGNHAFGILFCYTSEGYMERVGCSRRGTATLRCKYCSSCCFIRLMSRGRGQSDRGLPSGGWADVAQAVRRMVLLQTSVPWPVHQPYDDRHHLFCLSPGNFDWPASSSLMLAIPSIACS